MDFWVMLGRGFVGGFGLLVVAVGCGFGLVKERREVFVIFFPKKGFCLWSFR